MHDIGYSGVGEAKPGRVRQTNTQQLEEVTPVSSVEGEIEEGSSVTGDWELASTEFKTLVDQYDGSQSQSHGEATTTEGEAT